LVNATPGWCGWISLGAIAACLGKRIRRGGQGVHCLSDDDEVVEDGIECHLGRVRVVVVFRAEELFLGQLGPCDCFENVVRRSLACRPGRMVTTAPTR
jgi:hypothetical protein